ncbi:cyd operon YbgE family protein [Ralstonia soli]|uniref:Cyd operon YbgE family protein n=1 Tax=Ralstonia soli TaxID=2953896 RepID=A0ABT1AN97_9RALS|nr:cyd operon YbgE family protein [Ralstonia soli]MCO5399892.1 cyd operon YbgE family protein [Ralstonia soli]
MSPAEADATKPRMHLPSLAAGLLVMAVGTVYPYIAANRDGQADHGLAMLLFWAMSAGLVRGVGFIPRHKLWRVLFSGAACALALVLFGLLRAFG